MYEDVPLPRTLHLAIFQPFDESPTFMRSALSWDKFFILWEIMSVLIPDMSLGLHPNISLYLMNASIRSKFCSSNSVTSIWILLFGPSIRPQSIALLLKDGVYLLFSPTLLRWIWFSLVPSMEIFRVALYEEVVT